jgi:antitoxin MazE
MWLRPILSNFEGMFTVMKTRLVKVGNSRGIRIPKPLLEQSGLKTDVEIEVEGNALIIRSAELPRQNWEEAFQAMAAQGDDGLLDAPIATDWEVMEWDWS